MMFILILLFISNSLEVLDEDNDISKIELLTCLNSSNLDETISEIPISENSTFLYSQFEDYFFGNPEQSISRNISKAIEFLKRSSDLGLKEAVFAWQVLKRDSSIADTFSSINSYKEVEFEPIEEIKSTTKTRNYLSIFYLASILDCMNLRKIDLNSIFPDLNSSVPLLQFPFELGDLCSTYKKTTEAALMQAHSAKRHVDKMGISQKVISLETLDSEESRDRDYDKYLILNRKSFHRREHLDEILRIGQIYYFGSVPLGVDQNYEESLHFYKLGLKYGSKRAAARLGKMYLNGNGVKKNITKALVFLEKAEKQGSLEAVKTLTLLYEKGKEVEKNYTRAVELAKKGVELGDTQSFNNLGVYMMNGMGIKNDSQEAVKHFAIAAVLGSPAAMFNMAGQYYYGRVIQKDYLKSFNLSFFTIHSAQSDDYINKAVTRFKVGDYEGAYLYYLFASGLGYIEAYKSISYLMIKGLVQIKCKYPNEYCLKHYLALGLSRNDPWSAVQLSKIMIKQKNHFALNVLENSAVSGEKMFYLAYAYQTGIGHEANLTQALETYELLIELAENKVVDPYSKFPAYLAMWLLKLTIKISSIF